jgi:hypothetical protein
MAIILARNAGEILAETAIQHGPRHPWSQQRIDLPPSRRPAKDSVTGLRAHAWQLLGGGGS